MWKSLFLVFALSSSLLCSNDKLIRHAIQCIENAENGLSKLDEKTLAVPGMSSPKLRFLLNNLCTLQETSYLEIGCWKGSTLIASLYQNNPSIAQAIAIDNWSQFDGPRQEFIANVDTFLQKSPLQIIEQDCFRIDFDKRFSIPVNVYFYDGGHTVRDQERAFTYFNSIFADVFIAVIDDWNTDDVRTGTRSAFKKLGYTILFEREFFTPTAAPIDWNNGVYIAVIQK